MPYSKKDLAKNISNKAELSSKESSALLNEVLNFLVNNQESKVNINRFGTFITKRRPQRVGRNPKTLEEFNIPSSKKFFFKPSKVVKKVLN